MLSHARDDCYSVSQAKVYQKCSSNQVIFRPARVGKRSINGVRRATGVVDVQLNYNICGNSFYKVGNDAKKALSTWSIWDLPNKQYDFAMYILPPCVNFDDGVAWAMTPGRESWLQSDYASLPNVQVHEMGHNLGQVHSGTSTSSHADPTCYMGNKGLWTDEGSKMCFNPAKLYYFNWYRSKTIDVMPESDAIKAELIGIDDMSKRASQVRSEQKMILHLESTSGQNLFIMYNRKRGINKGVRGAGNKLLVTKQDGPRTTSVLMAALDTESGRYVRYDWGGNGNGVPGKTLIIETCGKSFSTTGVVSVHIRAYVNGHTYIDC